MTLVVAKWVLDEYRRMIAARILDERYVELLNGEIVEMAPEGMPHAHLSNEAADYVRELLGKRIKVREGKSVTLPSHSKPEPDIVGAQPLGDVYLEHHPFPKNIFWLIEFFNSSLKKDLEVKFNIHANANTFEY